MTFSANASFFEHDTPHEAVEASSHAVLRVLIADDYEVTRYGLALMLNERADIQVVGQADTGRAALAMAQELRPDVVLMDIMMPEMTGIDAAKALNQVLPDTRIIILTSSQDLPDVRGAIAAGVNAFCLKDIKIDRLCEVMRIVQDGSLWLDPAVVATVGACLTDSGKTSPAEYSGSVCDESVLSNTSTASEKGSAQVAVYQAPKTYLTQRETEVLGLIVGGKSNKEIAQHMAVTTHTAKAHVCKIIQKLGVSDRTQAAVKALQDGLISVNGKNVGV